MRRCFGITRNLTRCNRTGEWIFFCREHRKQPLVWITFIIFTIIAGSASIYSVLRPSQNPGKTEIHLYSATSPTKPDGRLFSQASSSHTQAKISIPEPIISCILDDHPVNKGFFLFTVKNEGLTPAKSVSVDYLQMHYLWEEQKIKFILGENHKFEYNDPGRNWLFIPQLDPNEVAWKLAGSSILPDDSTFLNIQYFHVKFLSPELGLREKNCIYFAEGDRIYSYVEYKTNKQFSQIDQEIKRALAEDVLKFKGPDKHKRQ